MGVTKETLRPGNGQDMPGAGDTVQIHYTGCLFDEAREDSHYMGSQCAAAFRSLVPEDRADGEQVRQLVPARTAAEDADWGWGCDSRYATGLGLYKWESVC